MFVLPPPAPDPASLSSRFRFITAWVGRTAAAKAGKDWRWSPLVMVLWSYLNRLADRFERLLARIEAGQKPRTRDPEAAAKPRPPPDGKPSRQRLPKTFGMLEWMGHEMCSHATQLEAFLADPRMAALLESDPRISRLLRPLCHLLGLRLAPVRPPEPAAVIVRPPPDVRPPLLAVTADLSAPDVGPPGIFPQPA